MIYKNPQEKKNPVTSYFLSKNTQDIKPVVEGRLFLRVVRAGMQTESEQFLPDYRPLIACYPRIATLFSTSKIDWIQLRVFFQ